MGTQTEAGFEKMIFRKTNVQVGRNISVTPQNSTMRHLAYGRIILDSLQTRVSFASGNRETALICLTGEAGVKVDGQEFDIVQYDAIYIPRNSSIEVSTKDKADLAEFSSDVEGLYPLKVVRYAETS